VKAEELVYEPGSREKLEGIEVGALRSQGEGPGIAGVEPGFLAQRSPATPAMRPIE
jgi:hypothetical protein